MIRNIISAAKNLIAQSAPPSKTTWGRGFYNQRSFVTGLATEDHFPWTTEGYPIFIKKIYVPDAIPKGILVCAHGSWENGNVFRMPTEKGLDFLSLDHTKSLTNFFAAQGYLVYVLNFLGPRVNSRYVINKYGKNYTPTPFDEISFQKIVNDLAPTALNYIAKNDPGLPIFWLGHSLGGLAIYAYLATHCDERIRAAVKLGSPVQLSKDQLFIFSLAMAGLFYKLTGLERMQPVQLLSEHAVTATKIVKIIPDSLLKQAPVWNFENTTPDILRLFIEKGTEGIPPEVFYFLVNMALTHQFTSLPLEGIRGLNLPHALSWLFGQKKIPLVKGKEPKVDYGACLCSAKTPILAFYGEEDKVASESSIRPLKNMLPCADVEFAGVPKAGHCDLVFGKNAKEKVWQPALEFMERLREGVIIQP
ncbi:MAG: alpha/beta hydrolase [Candidatus Margulisiibacteriota bacterium]